MKVEKAIQLAKTAQQLSTRKRGIAWASVKLAIKKIRESVVGDHIDLAYANLRHADLAYADIARRRALQHHPDTLTP